MNQEVTSQEYGSYLFSETSGVTDSLKRNMEPLRAPKESYYYVAEQSKQKPCPGAAYTEKGALVNELDGIESNINSSRSNNDFKTTTDYDNNSSINVSNNGSTTFGNSTKITDFKDLDPRLKSYKYDIIANNLPEKSNSEAMMISANNALNAQNSLRWSLTLKNNNIKIPERN